MKIETAADNMMIFAAHRYCFSRASYIVSECVGFLINHWTQIDRPTQIIILRDTIEGLDKGEGGMEMDKSQWRRFLWLVLPELDDEQKQSLQDQLRNINLNEYYSMEGPTGE